MLRNESFYKKTFGAINLEILKQIEDIKANKGNKTAESVWIYAFIFEIR